MATKSAPRLVLSDRKLSLTRGSDLGIPGTAKSGRRSISIYIVVVFLICLIPSYRFLNSVVVQFRHEDIFQGAPLIGELKSCAEHRSYADLSRKQDGHNDFAIWIRAFYQNHIYQSNFTATSKLYGQVDFPRLHLGRVRGQFWSVYIEW
jgi:hypothetical protein